MEKEKKRNIQNNAKPTLSALPQQEEALRCAVARWVRHSATAISLTTLTRTYTGLNLRIAQGPCLKAIEKGRLSGRKWYPDRQVLSIAAQPSSTAMCCVSDLTSQAFFNARWDHTAREVRRLGALIRESPSNC